MDSCTCFTEAEKRIKVLFFVARPLRGKGLATKKKDFFFNSKKIPKKSPPKNVAKLEGGGVRPFKELFCGFP